MKTKGVEVWEGYLAAGWRRGDGTWTPTPTIVPDAFWARLKQRVAAAGLNDAFKADGEFIREQHRGHDVEIVMFKRWVSRLGVALPRSYYGDDLWPWSRGWTDEAVDAYLTDAPARRAA